MVTRARGLAVAFAALSACAPVDEPALGSVSQAIDTPNGTWINGTWINGTALNGTWINGTWINGTWINGTVLDGTDVENVRLSSSMLVGWWRGAEIRGEELEGAELNGTADDGSLVKLRIDDAVPPASSSGVWSYLVTWKQAPGSWANVCADGARVIAVSGRWNAGGAKVDDGAITFACRGASAIAKCVDMGYRPWVSIWGRSLDPYHQACVRMVRADICGDGTTHTVDGRVINVYDSLGVQDSDDNGLLSILEWAFEAEWTGAGARCISVDARDRFLAAGVIPSCLLAKVDLFCGGWWRFATGTLIMNDIRALEIHLGGLL